MKFKLSQTQQYFLGIFLVAVLGALIYLHQKNRFSILLEKDNYTIGKIVEIKKYRKRQDHYIYYFSYDSKRIKREIASSKSNNLYIGKRYFVIFEEGNPENSMLIPFMFVPDNIIETPEEGWKEPPVPIDKEKIRQFLKDY